MKRLRFFRVLLPVLLIPFLVVVVLQIERRPRPIGSDSDAGETEGARVEGVHIVDFEGTALRLLLSAGSTEGDVEEGHGVFHDVDRLELGRSDGSPLILSASRVEFEGPPGERLIRIEGGIEVQDEDAGMVMRLPALDVDEAGQEARSDGSVELEAPGYRGTADVLVYRLDEEPSTLFGLEANSREGGWLRADRATLLEGPEKVELRGNVRARQGHDTISAPRMIVCRREDGSLERVEAYEGVAGSGHAPDQEAYWFRAEEGVWEFDDQGEAVAVLLVGDAAMQRGDSGLAAARVQTRRRADPRVPGGVAWHLEATGGVFARGPVEGTEATLQADRVEALADVFLNPLYGEARGNVRFEGQESVAQAAWAEVRPTPIGVREVHLHSEGPLRARLAGDRRRVAADRIVTRPGDNYFRAEGRVESTLLPAEEGSAGGNGLFDGSVAVHFVSRSLESGDEGRSLVFDGAVRGWQGERNLSAERVVYREATDEIHASGGVTTRMPRVETVALTEADYIQVSGRELLYSGADALAVFQDEVRVRQTEGWMECKRLEVHLTGAGRTAELIRGYEDVRLEYRTPGEDGVSEPVDGSADRVEYRVGDESVRLFGEQSHATVRRGGKEAVTTRGRVLLYRVDTGRVRVESGEQDRAIIRTSGSD